MATVRDSYGRELFFGRNDLTFIAKGHWPGQLDSLSTVLRQFYDLNKKLEFGKYLWVFAITSLDGKPMRSSVDGNEHMWLVGTAWTGEQRQTLPETECIIENGKTYYPNAPYGKIFATKVAKGWRVEFWHDALGIDPTATKNYLNSLFSSLVEDGLEPVHLPSNKQPKQATSKEVSHSSDISSNSNSQLGKSHFEQDNKWLGAMTLPTGKGWILKGMSLEDALNATKEVFAYMFLKYEIKEKTTEAATIQFFDSNKESLGKIEIKQGENRLDYGLCFDSLRNQQRTHELGLIDELWMVLEAFGLEDVLFPSLSAQEASKAIERALAYSGWHIDTQKIEETIVYKIEVPEYKKWYVRITFSPSVQINQFELSWRLQEREEYFEYGITRIPPRPVTRFVAKVVHEIKKGMQKAKQSKLEDQEIIVTEQSRQADENAIIKNPWDKIPDYRWDRRAVRMLWEGHQDPEIARKLNVVSKTVTNRLSALRQQYPDSVPTRDELRRKKSNR